jgi:hypothetical protein
MLSAVAFALVGCARDSAAPVETGTVQRASLSVQVSILTQDRAIATAAGVTVSGLTVRLTRDRSADPPRSAVTDATGAARFDDLLEGGYQLSVDRPLSAEEVARLEPADREASVFAGGATFTVTPPSRNVTVNLVASRRGSIIISEVFLHTVLVPNAGTYGKYIEFYNNSDTTIYMDGMLYFQSDPSYTSQSACVPLEQIRMDSSRVWTRQVERFPGNGRDYAILPGEAKVLTIDAVDHRLVGEGMLDLREAHFEFIGSGGDPNNPYSADMVRLRPGASLFHGADISTQRLHGIALAVARTWDDLERRDVSFSGNPGTFFELGAIPRTAILDIAAIYSTPETQIGPYCSPPWPPAFDRAPAELSDWRVSMAVSRRSLGRTAEGREILQRTGTSARDFETAAPLRRSLLRPR